ncbi:MAG TPA: DinB family protein, partial [Longimicrobium sp.]|nr:DinB family protein [Longimicrobium sp.]
LFFLDYYLSDSFEDFVPPAPFNLDELDPAGVLPPRVYTKDEMRAYLRHGRAKAQAVVEGLTEERAREHRRFSNRDGTLLELVLVSLRHVQHHTAQLNLILRQTIDDAPRWVGRAKEA